MDIRRLKAISKRQANKHKKMLNCMNKKVYAWTQMSTYDNQPYKQSLRKSKMKQNINNLPWYKKHFYFRINQCF